MTAPSIHSHLRVLIVTSEWPSFDGDISGIHVRHQVARLRELGLSVDVFHFRGRQNPARYAQAIIRFHRQHPSRYDVIHAHHGQSGIVALSQRARPVVVTFHGSDLQGMRTDAGRTTLSGVILHHASRLVASRADAVIIVAEHLKAFVPERAFHLIPAGIDLELFQPCAQVAARQRLGWPLDKRLVLFVGSRARTEKRQWLAQATVDLLPTSLGAELIVADHVPHEAMPLYMNACDALLVTSSSEGSPNVVKEALACNLPIVSVEVGDIRRRIEAIDGCVICRDDRPETIAAAVQQVLDRQRRVEGRAAVEELDERWLAQKVMAIYEVVFRRHRNGRS